MGWEEGVCLFAFWERTSAGGESMGEHEILVGTAREIWALL